MADETKKRKSDTLVDPDTNTELPNAKKPKLNLNEDVKEKCLKAIVEGFKAIRTKMYPPVITSDDHDRPKLHNISVGNHIANILFTMHTILRQKAQEPGVPHNTEQKSKTTAFKANHGKQETTINLAEANKIWVEATTKQGLTYKKFEMGDKSNWYGTMGPYLDMFCAFALRMNEVRLGHHNFPIKKDKEIHISFPVSKYGLSGAHHVLLEGSSFPPERRSSIVQSLGPMTAWICMIRGESKYRNKYANAVKRAMAHVPGIDDNIELTKHIKLASEISPLTTLIAEILLVTTARQATRMFFPLTLFAARDWTDELYKSFNTTGKGGWLLYKELSSSNNRFTINLSTEEETASQIVFHSIFGTYKEDLGILKTITNVDRWYTREEMKDSFKRPETTYDPTVIRLPIVKYYSKMSCANQTGLLTGVYNQVATVPYFSGKRVHLFDADFFEHIEKKRNVGSIGRSLPQIIANLTSQLEELHELIKKKDGRLEMGTITRKDIMDLIEECLSQPNDIDISDFDFDESLLV